MNGMLFLENYLLEKPTRKYGITFSSAPILLRHFCVVYTNGGSKTKHLFIYRTEVLLLSARLD